MCVLYTLSCQFSQSITIIWIVLLFCLTLKLCRVTFTTTQQTTLHCSTVPQCFSQCHLAKTRNAKRYPWVLFTYSSFPSVYFGPAVASKYICTCLHFTEWKSQRSKKLNESLVQCSEKFAPLNNTGFNAGCVSSPPSHSRARNMDNLGTIYILFITPMPSLFTLSLTLLPLPPPVFVHLC